MRRLDDLKAKIESVISKSSGSLPDDVITDTLKTNESAAARIEKSTSMYFYVFIRHFLERNNTGASYHQSAVARIALCLGLISAVSADRHYVTSLASVKHSCSNLNTSWCRIPPV